MPKKSDSQHENRGHGGQKAERGQRGGKMDDFHQQGRQDGSGNRADLRQQGRQDGFTNQGDFQQNLRDGKSGNRSDYRQQIREKKLVEGAKAKNGCFSKLFMLVLPFIAVGTFLFLRS